jgi:hypothetical protein
MPCGQFKPYSLGNAKVYDLGGNAAEFDAKGQVYGFSAYDFCDPYSPKPSASSRFIGFRVVL